MAAGKSTVAQALTERFPKCVHLRGDIFRRMIVRGRAEMTAELSPEAVKQLELRYRLATSSALHYLDAGFPVVYQDIVIGRQLPLVVAALQHSPLYVVVLCPVRRSQGLEPPPGKKADTRPTSRPRRSMMLCAGTRRESVFGSTALL